MIFMRLLSLIVFLGICYLIFRSSKKYWDNADIREKEEQLIKEDEQAKEILNFKKRKLSKLIKKNRKIIEEFKKI